MRLTLIALLLAGVVGCDATPADNPGRPVGVPKPATEDGADSKPESELEATLKAAEQGDAVAQCQLGLMYDFGRGVPKNEAEAVKWYHKAAEQGDADAQNNLGVMYDIGKGVPKDEAEAVKWWLKAAERGHAVAQFNLANMYYAGKGVPKDYPEAYAWYSIATANGDEQAKESLPKAKAKLTPEQLVAAQQRATTLFEQINANKAK